MICDSPTIPQLLYSYKLCFMKSGKQRKKEIQANRSRKRSKLITETKKYALRNKVQVNESLLRETNSYGIPDFVERGYYKDRFFKCKDCGKEETWRATQQKWWYEIAKGDVWTTAVRCRPCRKKERARKAEARRVHLEGIAANET